ncbi:unnamed protein product [Symbiodinium sp. CCMP2592]|nr:unnamed protein product [Symbiodinium sp. CCMP2592]
MIQGTTVARVPALQSSPCDEEVQGCQDPATVSLAAWGPPSGKPVCCATAGEPAYVNPAAEGDVQPDAEVGVWTDWDGMESVVQRPADGGPWCDWAIPVACLEAACSNLTQQQMWEIFIRGMRPNGRFARLALRGEEVQTVVSGETVATTIVNDDTSYVIQQDSDDFELHVLSQETFERNYELPGFELLQQGPAFDFLRAEGFRYFQRKGPVGPPHQDMPQICEDPPPSEFDPAPWPLSRYERRKERLRKWRTEKAQGRPHPGPRERFYKKMMVNMAAASWSSSFSDPFCWAASEAAGHSADPWHADMSSISFTGFHPSLC